MIHSVCVSVSYDGLYLPPRAVSGKTVAVIAPDDWPGQLVNAIHIQGMHIHTHIIAGDATQWSPMMELASQHAPSMT